MLDVLPVPSLLSTGMPFICQGLSETLPLLHGSFLTSPRQNELLYYPIPTNVVLFDAQFYPLLAFGGHVIKLV